MNHSQLFRYCQRVAGSLAFCLLCVSSLFHCSKTDPIKVLQFNPADGVIIREPEGRSRGYWVGSPGIFYDSEKAVFYLTYRYHTHDCYPNTNIMMRGHSARIASSKNGVDFFDVREFRNQDFGSSSLGRAALIKMSDGRYRYFMCHDNLAETQWVIGVIEASSVEGLRAEDWKPLFTVGEATKESLRDPYVFFYDGRYHLLVTIERIHWSEKKGYEDKYEGITVKRSTGLATSADGIHFDWKGEIFKPPDSGWDSDCRRMTAVMQFNDQLVSYYDGSSGYENNHEDKCGLALGPRIDMMTPVDSKQFMIASPWGTRSCRFVDVIRVHSRFYFYYECCREDESHNLRVFSN